MKKRILSIVLATALVFALASPASAAQHTYFGTYDDATYEVVDNLYLDQFNSNIMCSELYMVHSNVVVTLDTLEIEWYWGTPRAGSSTTRGGSVTGIYSIECNHHVDGYFVHTNTMRNIFK